MRLAPAALVLLAASVVATVEARTKVKLGINAFTIEQDVELGRELGTRLEDSLALIREPSLTGYVDRVGQRVAAHSPLPRASHRFHILDTDELSSFSLPGGITFISRGLLAQTRDEAELAGLLAHEIGHTAARHGTN